MVNLISRNCTLFSIIDGKEIVCKDQEQAKAIILKYINPNNTELMYKEDFIYYVYGYTVMIEEECGDVVRGFRQPGTACGRIEGCCYFREKVAVISLEAPEKDDEFYCRDWNKNGYHCEEQCKRCAKTKDFVIPEENLIAEQPAQPVDKQEGMAIYDAIKFFGKTRWSLMGTNMQNDIIEFANFIDSQRVSPSPERGESDERERLKNYLIDFMDERIALCDNISDNTPEEWKSFNLIAHAVKKELEFLQSVIHAIEPLT